HSALREVDLEVEPGECLVLLGPSGCGKTTLLRLLAGLETQDAGRLWIGDREVTALAPAERDVAMVFQSYALYPHMTVFENIAFPLRARHAPAAAIAPRVGRAAARLALLRAGAIEQVAAPLELYRRPSTRFAATFVGSPAINLWKASAAGHASLRVLGLDLPAPAHVAAAVARGAMVEVGVRPED